MDVDYNDVLVYSQVWIARDKAKPCPEFNFNICSTSAAK